MTIIACDTNGTELCRSVKILAGGEHEAYIVREGLPCATGRDSRKAGGAEDNPGSVRKAANLDGQLCRGGARLGRVP